MVTVTTNTDARDLLEFLTLINTVNNIRQNGIFNLVDLGQFSKPVRVDKLKEVIKRNIGNRAYLSHPSLEKNYSYVSFRISDKHPLVPYWDCGLLSLDRNTFHVEEYPFVDQVKQSNEEPTKTNPFDLDYQRVNGLIIPNRVNKRIESIDFYFI